MPLYDALLDIQKKQADIQHVDALTQLDNMRAQQAQTAMKADAAARAAFRNAELARQTEQTLEKGERPPSENPVDNNPRLKAINDTFLKASADYKHYQNLARQSRLDGGIDPKIGEKFDDDAAKALDQMQNAQLRLLAERKAILGELGSTAGSANAMNWPQVKATLDSSMPGWDKGQDVDFSPLDGGQVVWGPRTERAVKTLAEQALTRHQQVERDEKSAQQLQTQKRDDALRKEYESRERKREADVKISRENLDRNKSNDATKASERAAKAAGRPVTLQRPTKNEVDTTADTFKTEFDLTRKESRQAATDYLNRTYDIMRADPKISRADAEDQAKMEIRQGITPGTEGESGFLGFGGKDPTPPTYKKPGKEVRGAITPAPVATDTTTPITPAQLTTVVADAIKSGKKEISVNGTPMKVVGSDADYASLPSGTVFVGPDGKKRKKP